MQRKVLDVQREQLLMQHRLSEQKNCELLDVRRQQLGPEHPDTLTTMSHLAFSLSGQGKRVEAEQMFRELLDLRRRVLGPQHRDTLATLSELASFGSICSTVWSWTCSVSTSIWQFLARTLIASLAWFPGRSADS